MIRLILLAFVIWTTAATSSGAQEWPTRAVRIVVPFGAGSTPDVIARLIAERLQQTLGQAFVVENKPGASGNIGTDAVAKAAPDGATIGISIGGPLAINPLLFAKLPYNPARDLAPITLLTTQASVLAVNARLGIDSIAGLIARLKAAPGKYNFGSIGTGSLSHLAIEAIALKSGTTIVHVPYASSPQAMTAVIRNDVQMACLPVIAVAPHAASGAVRMLAVSTATRSPFFPGVPTLKESGIDVEADAWNGLVAPAGTPAAIVAKINRAAVAAVRSPEVQAKLATQFMQPVGTTPEEFRARIAAEVARWAPIIRAANIQIK
jgi:tripartite-type tricarboxylate transporter receptor subunit TctC